MKKIMRSLLVFIFPAVFILSGCNNNSEDKKPSDAKVTDIPATTKSKEALEVFRQGMVYYDLNETKKARESFNKAIELDPTFGLAYLLRANTDQSAKEYGDDIASGKANLDSSSSWEKMYADYMNTNLTGERNKGIEILQKITADYPDAARAQADLGFAYDGNNQFGKGREAYIKAVQINPEWVVGYSALAGSYLFNEPRDLKKAEENALKIVSLAPKSAGAQITLGDAYRAQNDFQKAKDSYTKAIELDTTVPEAYYKLGHANTYLGNLDEARKNYNEAGMRDVSRTASVLNTGYTYLYAGDPKTASNYLLGEVSKMDSSAASASKLANEKSNLVTTIATIAVHNGDAATLKKIVPMIQSTSAQITIDLGNTAEAKIFGKADSLHWQAMIALTEGKYDEANSKEEAMKTVLDPIKDDRKLEGYHADLGLVCMKQKNYKDAITHFEKADPNSIYYRYMLAKANDAAGMKDKALALYKEVAAYNFNGIDNALVRNEVKKMLATP
ncbi:MAG: tetratricopeptide repeat protein [Ferruginibacter sp.]